MSADRLETGPPTTSPVHTGRATLGWSDERASAEVIVSPSDLPKQEMRAAEVVAAASSDALEPHVEVEAIVARKTVTRGLTFGALSSPIAPPASSGKSRVEGGGAAQVVPAEGESSSGGFASGSTRGRGEDESASPPACSPPAKASSLKAAKVEAPSGPGKRSEASQASAAAAGATSVEQMVRARLATLEGACASAMSALAAGGAAGAPAGAPAEGNPLLEQLRGLQALLAANRPEGEDFDYVDEDSDESDDEVEAYGEGEGEGGGGGTGTSGEEGAAGGGKRGGGRGGAGGDGERRPKRSASFIPVDTMSGIEITEPDAMFDPTPLAVQLDPMGCFVGCGGICGAIRGEKSKAGGKPNAEMVAQLNDPTCEPLTLVYCLFRFRNNQMVTAMLLEKLECHAHPERLSAFTLHLCYLMLLEPLAASVEFFLLQKCRNSLHHALQVYWFCQGMIEDHDESPGPCSYQRFLRMQREVQTGVGHRAEATATTLIQQHQRSDSFDRRQHLRTLERTNKALSDAISLRAIFYDVTKFVDRITRISATLRATEPRSERDATLVRELERLKADMPSNPYLPAHEHGTFQRVLNLLPAEAKSFPTHARNPYMLFLEVEEAVRPDSLSSSMLAPLSPIKMREKRKTRRGRAADTVRRKGGAAKAAVRKGAQRAVGNVLELKEKRSQRKDQREAEHNDPFSVTETRVEHTAQMQQGGEGRASPATATAAHSEWLERKMRVVAASAHAHNPHWALGAFMVKADDDVRQEVFCMHLIGVFQGIFRAEGLHRLADGLRPYTIQSTSSQTGLIEALTDAQSVDAIKRRLLKSGQPTTLEHYYRTRFVGSVSSAADAGADAPAGEGGEGGEGEGVASFEQARTMCMYSVAAYSIVQYILALKDRHNGNILIDSRGRMVHIDFAFMLGWAPGGITFEKTAFKLTRDIVDVWGGRGSPIYDEFTNVMVQGMHAVQTHHQSIMQNVELILGCGAKFPCFTWRSSPGVVISPKVIISQLRRRFRLYMSKHRLRRYTINLIDYAYDNFWTNTYAKFQLLTNGIVP